MNRFLKKKQGRKRSGKQTITESSAKRTSMNSSGRGWGDGVPLDKGINNNKDTSLDELCEATARLYPEDEPTYRVYKDKPVIKVTTNPIGGEVDELFRVEVRSKYNTFSSFEQTAKELCDRLLLIEEQQKWLTMDEKEFNHMYYGVWKFEDEISDFTEEQYNFMENRVGDL